jgi:alkylhydroperoxidase/carboxymuconolactone decarboxylase family protein YurZ
LRAVDAPAGAARQALVVALVVALVPCASPQLFWAIRIGLASQFLQALPSFH